MPDSAPTPDVDAVARRFFALVEDVQAEVIREANATAAARDSLLLAIAKRHTGFETLETRNHDALDFHEVSAEGLRRAMVDAYEAGRAAAVAARSGHAAP